MYKKLITNKGFTLLELVVVIAVVAILAVAVAPNFLGQIEQSHVSKTLNDYDTLKKAVLIYHADTASHPSTSDDLLINPGLSTWQGPYLDRIPPRVEYTNDGTGNIYLTFTGLSASVASTSVTHLGDLAALTDEGFVAQLVGNLPLIIPAGYIPIATISDLESIGSGTPHLFAADTSVAIETEGAMDSNYIMVMDIDLDGANLEPIGYGPETDYTLFTGIFDGNNHKIYNGEINYPNDEYIGLFAHAATPAEIKNLGIENVTITGRMIIGGLVGYIDGVNITNCYTTGTVTSTEPDAYFLHAGGLVGQTNNSSIIIDSYSTSDIIGGDVGGDGSSGIGGLVGRLSGNSVINNCYATGNVTIISPGGGYAGGLVGLNTGSQINNSHATGNVEGQYGDIGGLVGNHNSYAYINNSYSTGNVTGAFSVGGLVGSVEMISHITNSYSMSNVTGETEVGGLVGNTKAWQNTITNCYAVGSVTGNSDVGGLLGTDAIGGSQITNSYYNTQTSGQTDDDRGLPRTTDQLHQGYENSIIAGDPVYTDWDPTIWQFTPTNAYPTLR